MGFLDGTGVTKLVQQLKSKFMDLLSDQTVSGKKTFGDDIMAHSDIISYSNNESNVIRGYYLSYHGPDHKDAGMYANGTTVGSQRCINRVHFATASYNATTGALISGVAEYYRLPTVDTGMSANKFYDIITTKNLSDSREVTTATLSTGSWSNKTQAVTVTGVTATNTVFVTPAPASLSAYGNAGVYCSAQAANSLTFTCETVPSANLTVNIIILK